MVLLMVMVLMVRLRLVAVHILVQPLIFAHQLPHHFRYAIVSRVQSYEFKLLFIYIYCNVYTIKANKYLNNITKDIIT